MTATTPLWFTALVAFIAPAIAIVGVYFGQRMARTTAELQVKAQERRDQLAWAREDQHRFTEDRRDLYADFLATAEALIDNLEDHGPLFSREHRIVISGLSSSGGRTKMVHPFEWHPLNVLSGKIDLVSPRTISVPASQLSTAIFADANAMPAHENTDVIDIDIAALNEMLNNLRIFMREDLAPPTSEAQ
ncbi:hypothetical protein GCM10017691_24110 [Pseudonocardia petroleophila]|uniref:Uncharacterized protein n=1 Tax=Pseudonocardia petroleophila TaxID=37331 RepID=A0A7G7MFT4_9PSEU|nr:hypothetical protein [Pseudonocardia petroleophila]QNG51645.1 hypothetical protein H6H00_26655 [Pseudonocardia petroleophila]